MSYVPHAYLTFGGGIGQGDGFEDWASGLRFSIAQVGVDSVPTDAAMTEYLNDNILPALKSWFSAEDTRVSGIASLQWAKFNMIGANGRYLSQETIQVGISNVRGNGGTQSGVLLYPSQVSLAVTLETDASRGYASKGRMFLPAPRVNLGADGLANSAEIATVAARTATFIDAVTDNVISGALNYSFQPAVESKLGNGGNGTERVITSVSVDNRLDIQRSRAKSLRGTRSRSDV